MRRTLRWVGLPVDARAGVRHADIQTNRAGRAHHASGLRGIRLVVRPHRAEVGP